MHVHTNDEVISQSNSIASNKIKGLFARSFSLRFLLVQLNKGQHWLPSSSVANGIGHEPLLIILLQIWVLAFGNDRTGPADESKRTKRVQGWSRHITQ